MKKAAVPVDVSSFSAGIWTCSSCRVSVIGGGIAENMPGSGKGKKNLQQIPDGGSGRLTDSRPQNQVVD